MVVNVIFTCYEFLSCKDTNKLYLRNQSCQIQRTTPHKTMQIYPHTLAIHSNNIRST